MQELLRQFLRLPKVPILQVLFGFGVSNYAWVPSYALMQGSFFRHAVSTPVTVLGGFLEQSIRTQSKNKKLLQDAKQVCDSVQLLVTALTDLHPTTATFSVVSTTAECIQVCKLLNPSVSIVFQIACSESLQMHGSKVYWQEALSCVIKNACEAYSEDTRYKPVTVVLYEQDESLRLEIIDCATGMGSITKLVARLPGITEKPQGTGIGLTFVTYVVEKLFRGTMRIESTHSGGTRVRWVLPIT